MVDAGRVAKGLWWDRAWGLVQGCTKVSAGCTHCWAEREAHMRSRQQSEAMQYRFGGVTNAIGRWTGKVRFLEKNRLLPMSVKKPRVWAVWNDLFHEDVPLAFIERAYSVMLLCPRHTFIVLTKRADAMARFWSPDGLLAGIVSDNPHRWDSVWHLVTAEDQKWLDERVPFLLQVPSAVRGVSLEPLLGPVETLPFYFTQGFPLSERHLNMPTTFHGLDWVIVGAESGGQRRLCKPEWVRSIVDQCREAEVPVFVKQLHIEGRLSKDMAEWPEDLRVREFPGQTESE